MVGRMVCEGSQVVSSILTLDTVSLVYVAERFRHRIVDPDHAGSTPVIHPRLCSHWLMVGHHTFTVVCIGSTPFGNTTHLVRMLRTLKEPQALMRVPENAA